MKDDMPATIIRWEDPPPLDRDRPGGGARKSKYTDAAERLRDERGRWAVIHEAKGRSEATGVASKVRGGTLKCFRPRGDFEATVRTWNGISTVYARYLGS